MKAISMLIICLISFCACQKQDSKNIEIKASLNFLEKYGEEYKAYIPKFFVEEEPVWAEIVVNNSTKILPKSKATKLSKVLPAFYYPENQFLQLIKAAVIFDDERINLTYHCRDDIYCEPEPSQNLAQKVWDSKKYCVEIEFKVKNEIKPIKGRWFFGNWHKE